MEQRASTPEVLVLFDRGTSAQEGSSDQKVLIPGGLAEFDFPADDQLVLMTVDCIAGDRRADRRYDFGMDVRFTYTERGVTCCGAGVTVDLSRGGVRFESDAPPADGTEAELRIAWPFLLQGTCPLELVVWGTILGSREGTTVLKMRRYEFRTRGERSFSDSQDCPEAHCVYSVA